MAAGSRTPLDAVDVKLTAEEQAEQEIRAAPDAVEITVKGLALVGAPIVWTACESESLGKRVTAIPAYYEVTDEGRVVGHARWSEEKVLTAAGEAVETKVALVIGTRKRGE